MARVPEAYNARLAKLLKTWGDRPFASTLRTEAKSVKQEVLRRLDEYAIEQQMRKYPETSAVSKHPNFEKK